MEECSYPPIGLYVHVPFCASKCAYCDFASYAGREGEIPRYLDAVIQEIRRRGAETGHPRAGTIFLGGGTPSLLDEGQVARILGALFEAFSIEEGAEITCECNPGTLTAGLAEALRKAGVNRLSIGAQARQERLLRALGRIHDWEDVVASVEMARGSAKGDRHIFQPLGGLKGPREEGRKMSQSPSARQCRFENINLDLMFGLPTQGVADWRETLEAAIELEPTHVACYGLIVEEGTPICRDITAGSLALPEEEVEREMYELARRMLAEHGFEQYEISNFARPGYQCRHNIGCWTRAPYLGFGCAAHSFFDECLMMNPAELDAYLAGKEPKVERISAEDARFESMMLGLRMTRGVKDEDFTRMHGMSIREAFGAKLDRPIADGLLEWHEGALRLTRLGMDLQNSVLVDLM